MQDKDSGVEIIEACQVQPADRNRLGSSSHICQHMMREEAVVRLSVGEVYHGWAADDEAAAAFSAPEAGTEPLRGVRGKYKCRM